ncbi:MAG: hypothetical protein ACRD2W_07170 [Acidimicrobiales bacterium]
MTEGILQADQMAYRSRALAQTEPFTELARRLLNQWMQAERDAQPGNFAIWANAAFTKGYCIRKVEEDDSALAFTTTPDGELPPTEQVVTATDEILTALRSDDGDIASVLIADQDRLFDVLDQVIGSEVRNRTENAGTISSRARVELEDYITYWVVRGYALRAAEQATGAITPA